MNTNILSRYFRVMNRKSMRMLRNMELKSERIVQMNTNIFYFKPSFPICFKCRIQKECGLADVVPFTDDGLEKPLQSQIQSQNRNQHQDRTWPGSVGLARTSRTGGFVAV